LSLISFGREAGVVLSGLAAANDGDAPNVPALCLAVEAHLARLGLRAEQLEILYDPATAVLRISGCAANQDTRERIVLCCGNVRGVAAVDDCMTVLMPSEVSRWRFVQPGETLARIAHDLYRDPTREQHLRAANQPLLGDAEALEPGWLLRVPA